MAEVLTLDPRWGSGSGSERKEVRCRFVSIQLRLGTIYGKNSCVYTARPVVCSKHVGIIMYVTTNSIINTRPVVCGSKDVGIYLRTNSIINTLLLWNYSIASAKLLFKSCTT